MRETICWVADDGTKFDTREECEKYELKQELLRLFERHGYPYGIVETIFENKEIILDALNRA